MSFENWDLIISSSSKKRKNNLKELIQYRDLVFLFVRRDFISLYKQTILGPIWIILQPILTTITFAVVFGKIAKIETGIPPLLFYLLGITAWNYFSDCVIKTSETFIGNQNLFGKVYFPRLVVPISTVFTNLIKFVVQFVLYLLIYLYYLTFVDHIDFSPSIFLILLPIAILNMALLGMGIGLVVSALTTKYRDLRFLIQFGIQLAMFATPIVYPLKSVPDNYVNILQMNPMTPVIECFKVGFFGEEFAVFSSFYFAVSFIFSICCLLIGIRIFTRVERNFMDSI